MADTKLDFTGASGAGLGRKAIVLRNADSDPKVLKEVVDLLAATGYAPEVLANTPDNKIGAARAIQVGPREKSVCYIAGSGKGDDPELLEKSAALVRAVSDAGYNTVCPGSEGMMGVIVDEVRKLGRPVTSVFSLAVAQAFVEKLEAKFDRIIVAPDEDTRQELYHLLSGAQIALPGGTGTKAEAAAHYYKNGQIGLIYRRPEAFGPENFASPIIYFSPHTARVEDAVKKVLCERFFAGNPALQESVRAANLDVGYWDLETGQYDQIADMKFMHFKYRTALIETLRTPEQVVGMLDDWSTPGVRQRMTEEINIHYEKSRERAAFARIMNGGRKPGP